jgi:hypothetical protein
VLNEAKLVQSFNKSSQLRQKWNGGEIRRG